jgi:hypothetical protein
MKRRRSWPTARAAFLHFWPEIDWIRSFWIRFDLRPSQAITTMNRMNPNLPAVTFIGRMWRCCAPKERSP